ncbi:hypothetical protein L1887_56965 [Cichorium endivia]|nr:hypothetical protein L1887_56965 [Cichorium endivia]
MGEAPYVLQSLRTRSVAIATMMLRGQGPWKACDAVDDSESKRLTSARLGPRAEREPGWGAGMRGCCGSENELGNSRHLHRSLLSLTLANKNRRRVPAQLALSPAASG